MRDELADAYAAFEEDHWWCKGRRRILRALLAKHLRLSPDDRLLEVGVGSGVNLYTIYPRGLDLVGLEPHGGNAAIARGRGDVPVFEGTVENLPSELEGRRFNAITLLDVLEHIEDDRAAVDKLRLMLPAEGRLILAVPAYGWLWGRQDVASQHFRRYTLGGLRRMLEESGFQVERGTYFNTLLFPIFAVVRLAARLLPAVKPDRGTDLDVKTGALSHLLERVLAAERHALGMVDLPFGVSVFVAARKV